MIRRVTLKNFQVHRDKTFDMTKGLNVIFGDNNQGKSALQRAIFWNFTNKPLGEWMRPKCGKEMLESVSEIEFVDGFTSTRIRGDENKYIINGQEFTELGSEVPQVLAEYLGDLTLMLGRQKFYPNFLLPDDDMFMVRESSIAKGSLINYFTGFALIESIKKTISKDVRDNKGVIKGKKSSLKIVSEELNRYDQLDEWSKDNDAIQAYYKKVQALQHKHDLCVNYSEVSKQIVKLNNVVNFLEKRVEQNNKMVEIINKKDIVRKQTILKIQEYRRWYRTFKLLVTNNVTEKQIQDVRDSYNYLYEQSESLKLLKCAYEWHYSVTVYTNELKQIEEKRKELPDVCPACKRPL